MKNAKLKSILATSLVASMVLVMFPRGAFAEWKQAEDNSWSYEDNSGVNTGWKLIDGTWYNFDSTGVMKTGWINDNGTWYFTDASGAMKTGWVNDKGTWYFTETTGAMKTGWINDKGTWYFSDISGAMQTGVIKIDEKIYSFAPSGAMQVGSVVIGEKQYTFANSGEALENVPSVNKVFDHNGTETAINANSPTLPDASNGASSNNSGGGNGSGGHNSSGNTGGDTGGVGGNTGEGGGNTGGSGGTQPQPDPQPQPEKKWNLVWSDEFNGDKLDMTKWDYQLGDGSLYGVTGWGNAEEEYYTKKNSKVENGNLVIEARRDSIGNSNYSSAKIRTKGKYNKLYGRIESSMSLPAGQGLWPAFWMLPEEEGNGEYGGWASSGEIDIMEARGRELNKVDGTIHFGKPAPNNKSNGGSYVFPEGQDITEKHVYAVEWEPGEIRWYVDGNLYHKANNWYSQGSNEPEPYAYPAPFDKNFYIMLNLAVGGKFDGGLVPDAFDMPAQMSVDYVRVYDLDGGYPVHSKPIIKDPELTEGRTPSADGNYILDSNLNQVQNNTGKDLSHDNWNFLTTDGGNGSFTANGEEGVKVAISNGGTQSYSVQLIDHMPLRRDKHYKLTFEAKSDASKAITTQFGGGPDRGWSKYSDSYSSALTNEWKQYEYGFDMASTSDPYGRLEVNLGYGASNSVYIKNVRVEESDVEESTDLSKAPLENGEHLYNGTFNEGDDRKKYWDFNGNGTFTIDPIKRAAEIAINNAGANESVILSQTGTNLLQSDTYKLKFKAHASENRSMDVRFASNKGEKPVYASNTFNLTTADATYEFEFTMPNGVTDTEAVTAFLMGNAAGKVSIDDVSLVRLTNRNYDYSNVDLFPIKNGDFTLDGTYWEKYTDGGSADITFPESDKPAKIKINSVGGNPWSVMWSSNQLKLSKKLSYILEFDAWSDDARDMIAKIENSTYNVFVEKDVQLNSTRQHVKLEFTMNGDDLGQLKFLLGNTNNPKATTVYIDNVMLRVKDAPVKAAPTVAAIASGTPELDYKGQPVVRITDPIKFKYGGGEAGWDQAISGVTVNGEEVDPSNYVISNGTIVFNEGTFTEAGAYDIVIKAEGYLDVKLQQKLFSAKSDNFALGKSVVASSVREGLKEYITDGNPATRWSSNKTTAGQLSPENIYIDLGKIYSVENVKTIWEGACATQYEIQTCISNPTNEASWKTVETVTRAGVAGTDNVFFEGVPARYVRINCKIPALEWGYSIFEIEVHGADVIDEPVVDPTTGDTTGGTTGDTTGGTTGDTTGGTTGDTTGGTTGDTTGGTTGDTTGGTTGDTTGGTTGDTTGGTTGDTTGSTTGDTTGGTTGDTTGGTTGDTTGDTTGQTPGVDVNLALGKSVISSSIQDVFNPDKINDGDKGTRWASDWQANNDNHPEYAYVDLGKAYSIGNVKINWEGAFAKNYEIQVCSSAPEDEASWQTVQTVDASDGALDDITFQSVSAQYVRIYCKEMGLAPYGYSIWELEVYQAQ